MNPAALVIAYVSLWSIMVVGAYLVVVGFGNLRYQESHRSGGVSPFAFVRRQAFRLWDALLVVLGGTMACSAIVFLFLIVYG